MLCSFFIATTPLAVSNFDTNDREVIDRILYQLRSFFSSTQADKYKKEAEECKKKIATVSD
jgi:hypothetical protein